MVRLLQGSLELETSVRDVMHTLRRSLSQTSDDEFANASRGFRIERPPLRLGLHNRRQDIGSAVSIERFPSGESLVETARERPDVCTFVDRFSPCLLRTHVRGRPHDHPESSTLRQRGRLRGISNRSVFNDQRLRQPEIQDPWLPIRSDLDIRRLQVPMDDPFLMSSLEPLCNLDEQRDRFVYSNATLRNSFCQRLAFHQFHDDERLPVVLFETIERGDVRVVDLSEESGFSLESFQSIFVSCEFFGKHFDSDVTSESCIAGSVDFSHSTRTDSLDDFVLAELGAWGEGHG